MSRWLRAETWSSSLQDALGSLPTGTGIGLVQGSTGVAAIQVGDRDLLRHPAARDIGETVAVRVAVDGVELRWAAATEGGTARRCEIVDAPGHDGLQPIAALLPAMRIVWGTVAGVEPGWARMTEIRTGSLWVPAPGDAVVGQRLAFETHEVVVEQQGTTPWGAELTGNRAVSEELLTGRVVVAKEST